MLNVVFVAEGEGIVLHGCHPVGTVIEMGKEVVDACNECGGLQIVPYMGVTSGYLGQTGAGSDEHGLAELHGFDGWESEPFSLAGEEECLTIGIEPDALGVGDFACETDIGES